MLNSGENMSYGMNKIGNLLNILLLPFKQSQTFSDIETNNLGSLYHVVQVRHLESYYQFSSLNYRFLPLTYQAKAYQSIDAKFYLDYNNSNVNWCFHVSSSHKFNITY